MQGASYFRKMTNDQLAYSVQDIRQAMKVAATWKDNDAGGNKYADQLHAAVAERNRRTGANVCPCCKRPK